VFTNYLYLAADQLGSILSPDEILDPSSASPVIVPVRICQCDLIIAIVDISDAKHWVSETSLFRRPLIY